MAILLIRALKEDNNIMIGMAKRLAADAINEAVGKATANPDATKNENRKKTRITGVKCTVCL